MTLFASPQNCAVKRQYVPDSREFQYTLANVQNPWYLSAWWNIYKDRENAARMEDMKQYAALLDGEGRDIFYKRTLGK